MAEHDRVPAGDSSSTEQAREAVAQQRRVRKRWIGAGFALALLIGWSIVYQAPQRALDALGLRCGAGSGLTAIEDIEYSDVFEDWERAETTGVAEYDDGRPLEWDFTEEVERAEALAVSLGVEPVALQLSPYDSTVLAPVDVDTFAVDGVSGSSELNAQAFRVDFDDQQISWAYENDVADLRRPEQRAMTRDHLVSVSTRSVAGDQVRLELRTRELSTGELVDCHELIGSVDSANTRHGQDEVSGTVTGLDHDKFLVRLHGNGSESSELLDAVTWTGLYSVDHGGFLWESAADDLPVSLGDAPATAVTTSDALLVGPLPSPLWLTAPAGRSDSTFRYDALNLHSWLYAEQSGESAGATTSGRDLATTAYNLSDGSVLWQYPRGGDVALSLPVIPNLGEDVAGAALVLRAEMLGQDEHHDPLCAEGRGSCPVAWSLDMLDDDGSPLWSTDLPVGKMPGAWARWGDIVVRQEDEDWTQEHPANPGFSTITAYDLQTGEQLWELDDAAGPAWLDQAIETEDGWLLFYTGSGPVTYRILDPQTGEVVESHTSNLGWTSFIVDQDHITLRFQFHTAVFKRP